MPRSLLKERDNWLRSDLLDVGFIVFVGFIFLPKRTGVQAYSKE